METLIRRQVMFNTTTKVKRVEDEEEESCQTVTIHHNI